MSTHAHEPLATVRAGPGRRGIRAGHPFRLSPRLWAKRHLSPRREGGAGRSRRRRAGQKSRGRRVAARRQRVGAGGASPAAHRRGADHSGWLALVRADEDKRQRAMYAAMASPTNPPHPLYVCAEVGKRLGPTDVLIGDGGDFVATAAYAIKSRGRSFGWTRARWGHWGPRLRNGRSTGTTGFAGCRNLRRWLVSASMAWSSKRWCARRSRWSRSSATTPRGPQIRRGQVELYGEARAVATELAYTRYDEVVRALGGFGAWVTEAAEVGPALDAAFASGLPACVNVKIGPAISAKGLLACRRSLTSPARKSEAGASPLPSWGRILSACSRRLRAHGPGSLYRECVGDRRRT